MPQELHALRDRFRTPGVTFDDTSQGLTHATITTRAATARLYLHGAHVTHYQPAGAAPVLFMSERSFYQPGKPIRGGVPLIFPWFGPHPTDLNEPAHGWARTSPWILDHVIREDDDTTTLALSLTAHHYALTYTVRVGRELSMQLAVHNTGPSATTFEEALHTYLAVADVRRVRVEGLDGRSYLDKMDGGSRKTQAGPIAITGETDRVYVDTPDAVTVDDPLAGRRLVVSKESSATTVVCNPWVEKAKRMADFGDDEWPRMLCVETANAAENAVMLPAGGRHTLRATLQVEPVSRQ